MCVAGWSQVERDTQQKVPGDYWLGANGSTWFAMNQSGMRMTFGEQQKAVAFALSGGGGNAPSPVVAGGEISMGSTVRILAGRFVGRTGTLIGSGSGYMNVEVQESSGPLTVNCRRKELELVKAAASQPRGARSRAS